MYVLLDNAASDSANLVSVDRIGFVSLADPLNCAVEAAAVEAELVEAAVEAEAEALVDEAVEAVLEDAVMNADDAIAAMNLAGMQEFAAENNLIAQDDDYEALVGQLPPS